MGAKRVEFHQGAVADVSSAVAWYQERSPKAALDFIEELHLAVDTIGDAPDRWPAGKDNTQEIPSVAISFQSYLFRRGGRGHSLGCRPFQQATGILGKAS